MMKPLDETAEEKNYLINSGPPSQWDGALGIKNSLGGSLRPREIQMPGGEE